MEEKKCNSTEQLHFVISPGRCGTTLLRKHLIESSSIHIPPETSSFIVLVAKAYLENNSWEYKAKKAIDIFNQQGLNSFWEMDIDHCYKTLLEIPDDQKSLKNLIVHFYQTHASKYKSSYKVLVDKTPYLSLCLPWVTTIFPNSKYLFLIRDPYDVTFSRMENFDESLKEASNRWLWAVKEFGKYSGTRRWKLVFYEKLVENFDSMLLGIINFFQGDPISHAEKVPLGEENLAHHKRVFEKVKRRNKTTFNQTDYKYLKSKFENCTSKEINDFYLSD